MASSQLSVISFFIFTVATARAGDRAVEQWRYEHVGPGAEASFCDQLVVDAAGNSHVVGDDLITRSPTSANIATLKLDTNGTLVFSDSHDGPVGGHDLGHGVAVSPSGHVWTAAAADTGTPNDYLVLRYEPGGGISWTDQDPDHAMAWRAVTDSADRGFIAGRSYDPAFGVPDSRWNSVVKAYTPTGTVVWEQIFDGGFGQKDEPMDILVDETRDQVIALFSADTAPSGTWEPECAIVAYDRGTGSVNWETRHGSDLFCFDMTLDSDGHVVATGAQDHYDGPGLQSIRTFRLEPTLGGLDWSVVFDQPGVIDSPRRLVADTDGNTYTAAITNGTWSDGAADFLLIKLDRTGFSPWSIVHDGPTGGSDIADDVLIDADGDVVVSGRSRLAGGAGFLSVAWAPDGTLKWDVDSPRSLSGGGTASATDGSGNLWVAGSGFRLSDSQQACVVIKYAIEDAAPVVADAGPDQDVLEGDVVTLDGTSSTGVITDWCWDLDVLRDTDGDLILDNDCDQTSSVAVVDPAVDGQYVDDGTITVKLTVRNAVGDSSSDTAVITVENVDPGSCLLDVVLVDLDGDLIPDATRFTAGATDPGSDDLIVRTRVDLPPFPPIFPGPLQFDLFNDGLGADPLPSYWYGTAPFSFSIVEDLPLALAPRPGLTITLTVTDDDGGSCEEVLSF